jgi:hypothetical protein
MAFSRRNNRFNRWINQRKNWVVQAKRIALINEAGDKRYTREYSWAYTAGPFLLRRTAIRVANALDRIDVKEYGEYNSPFLHRVARKNESEDAQRDC